MCSENFYIDSIQTTNDIDGAGDDDLGMGLIKITCKNPING
jgi:hypothetical protein